MKIIEIAALDNGAHRNQNGSFSSVPDGWAVVPDDMELENFPFGEVEAEEVTNYRDVETVDKDGNLVTEREPYTVMTVTKWTPGIVPEVEPEEVEPTTEERVAALEEQLAETDEAAIQLYEANLAQEAVNAEQDEAIIEIYETMEGLLNG